MVLTRVALVEDELADLRAQRGDDRGLEQIAALLDVARDAALRPGSRASRWMNGNAINRAFINLHAAQVLLAKYTPDDGLDVRLLSAMTRLRSTLPSTAERRLDLERHYRDTMSAGPASRDRGRIKRWVLENALQWSYAATDAQYARLRNFRTIIIGVSVASLVLATALAAMGFFWPETLHLCFGAGEKVCPNGVAPSRRDAIVIEVLGAAGGALAAVLAVRKMQGTSTPYGVPLALALLKLPFGALSALLGLVLIHGRFVPGLTDLDTSGQIIAYAIFLGIAQHALTTLLDRRGQELLAGMPSKRSTAEPPGRAHPDLAQPRDGQGLAAPVPVPVPVPRRQPTNGRRPPGAVGKPVRRSS